MDWVILVPLASSCWQNSDQSKESCPVVASGYY